MEQLESMFEDPSLKNEQQSPEEVDGERTLIVDLIETVKAHPPLYDRQTGNFQDGRNRQYLWQSVGEEMKMKGHIVKGSLCREKWNSLKRRYIRELSTITSSADYSPRVSKWPYFNVFEFLQPYVQQNLPPVIKNESPLVDAENEAGTSAEQAFDENLGKLLGLESEPRRKRVRCTKVQKEIDEHADDNSEEVKFKNRSVMVKLWDTRNEAFVASLCGLTTFLDDEQLAAFQKDTLCDLARRLLGPTNKFGYNTSRCAATSGHVPGPNIYHPTLQER
uniref:MADF domain-containing protein n=1 Tax=Syphacia muris TaxID=451379 RepID=A0A0N5AEB4_9BILA